ncbi:aspartate kinase [bacterium]|nr:aspartate kinase [bacterium]
MNTSLRIMKFGGSSIRDADAIHNVIKIIKFQSTQIPMVLVFSAIGKTTSQLLHAGQLAASGNMDNALKVIKTIFNHHLEIANELIPDDDNLIAELIRKHSKIDSLLEAFSQINDLSLKSQDNLLAYGELMSTQIINRYFEKRGLKTILLDARELFVTNIQYTRAEPYWEQSFQRINKTLLPLLKNGQLPVIQGFIGATKTGETTTFGFEGSDYTASLIGAAMNALAIDVWKDVPGVMTTDPELCPDANVISSLSYEEAAALTFLGAKVLHCKTLAPAQRNGIPVNVRPLNEPENRGTTITSGCSSDNGRVKSITYKRNPLTMRLTSHSNILPHQLFHEVSSLFHNLQIQPILLTLTENRITAILNNEFQLQDRLQDLSEWGDLEFNQHTGTISLVGEGLCSFDTSMQKAMNLLKDYNISFISSGASPMQITIGVDKDDVDSVVKILHSHFFEQNGGVL